MSSNILPAALEAYEAALSVMPPKQDGSKRPDTDSWTAYQDPARRATVETIREWYANGRTGLGVFTGRASGNLEVMDFDDRTTYEGFLAAAEAVDLADLVNRIRAGCEEETPGGGAHLPYRCEEISGNTKLAQRPKQPDEMRHAGDKVKALIETRGEGGYLVVAPSYGTAHPDKKPYRCISGGFSTIATITPDERRALWALAKSFDQMPVQERPPRRESTVTEGRPGDDFNAKADWSDILTPHGWQFVFARGGTSYWRRPGKTSSWSATTNHANSDLLYVFSSSTIFEPERGYSKFSAYALLEHAGDFAAAAKELASKGYGDPLPRMRSGRNGSIPDGESTTDHENPRFHLTDTGNGERFATQHSGTIRYCWEFGYWLVWDGRRWVRDAGAAVQALAKRTVRSIYQEAADCADAKERKEIAGHATRSESDARITAMLSRARSETGIPVAPDALDSDPYLLNCLNGTIDLRTGILRPHNPDDLITKLAPVVFDPDARLPLWDHFIETITGGDAELAGFVQRSFGYTLTGSTAEEKLFFGFGPTASGKSTLLEAFKATLGDYAVTADFESFLARRGDNGPRNDLARLAGARFVVSVEVDDGRRLAEGLVKLLTGGDAVTARFLHKEHFEFTPAFKLWLAANDAPKARDNDAALWRRILRVPFEHSIPEDRRDPKVKATLKDPNVAGPAILAWAVRGCLDWHRRGLDVPAVVKASTEAYRADNDPIRSFLAECCVLAERAWTPSSQLREVYEEWSRESGDRRPLTGKEFGQRLRAYGCELEIRKRQRGWLGIGLLIQGSDPTGSTQWDRQDRQDRQDAQSPYEEEKQAGFTHSGGFADPGDPQPKERF